jgi:hypothetical protein
VGQNATKARTPCGGVCLIRVGQNATKARTPCGGVCLIRGGQNATKARTPCGGVCLIRGGQNATKARIPFYGSYTDRDPVKIAQEVTARSSRAREITAGTARRAHPAPLLYQHAPCWSC